VTRAVWTRQSLHELLQRDFAGVKVIAVSNREPYIHRRSGARIECVQPASGLTVALDPIMRATGGTWVAHGSGDADRVSVDAFDRVAVPPGEPSYTLRRVWLDPALEERYYYGLANEGLWPLCHIAFHRPVFRRSDWESYREANRIFADAVLEEADGQPAFVFIQDYHFALLPRMLKERNPNLTIAQFWHIPWPNRETFRTFPWKEELLDGLLGNDLLGFHLRDVAAAEMNGLPGARRPSGIDLVGDGGEFVVEPLIVADESPAGHGDLEEDELPAVLGVGLEQVVDGAQAIGNALRVIRAVDADS